MKNSNKKSKNPVVLGLYVISILLGIYTIFTVYSSYTYINSLVAQGLVISDELQSVISYYVGASAPYLVYTIAIWAIGYIINKLNYIVNEIKIAKSEDLNEEIISTDSEEAIIEKAIIEEAIITNAVEDAKNESIVTDSNDDTREEI